jgi:FkbM family methyltransferase
MVKFLKALRKHYLQRRFFAQRLVSLKCGDFEIESPANHLLVHILRKQPYRDVAIGVAAKLLTAKYPGGTLVDIGANIGDTAAIMATHSKSKLILVEPSDYFFEILSRNASRFPNQTDLVKALIGDGSAAHGRLHHWGGTAYFENDAQAKTTCISVPLSDIADPATCFVKIDTDGYDFQIVSHSLKWLEAIRPAVYFEDQIRTAGELRAANDVLDGLSSAGYAYFVVWDDPGLHILSTTTIDVLKDLNRYLFKLWENDVRKSLHNYDVLCLHERDEDIYQAVREWCRSY